MQVFQVEGMDCGSCMAKVMRAVQSLDPKAKVDIEFTSGRVAVETDESSEAICEVIAEYGYTVTPRV
ncbi:hypothetical protein GCM10007907_16770 [Chitinimonas prasina]|uniref:HMA domain-containing protein n=1 Tax=Chitinimonas prasina TaxID=1434937 RepID=A0ABQ5YD44_9NEIS|nr:heavy-metal-associated domain-containing protein [Chitinimonas prasina]GLR12887.1 hypothetical protein GCM10007907_16770 [Chitinimonas prasina]